MQLTRAGEYAIQSLVYLAMKGQNERVMAGEVATAKDIPVNFVRKILETLAKNGLVNSYRGAGGGFALGRAPGKITIRAIIEAIEGPIALNQCLAPYSCHRVNKCPIKPVWEEAQQAFFRVLDSHTLADIIKTADRMAKERETRV